MSHKEVSEGLDTATQKHEKEIVIDLSADRILHHLGVYLVIIIAIVTKITEVTGQKLACFPVGQNKSSLQFINYVNAFCWESSQAYHFSPVNNETTDNGCPYPGYNSSVQLGNLLDEPTNLKRLILSMPYAFLLEAFLFALPMAYWHFTVGASLMAHLKFMELLIEGIYENVKQIPAGIYRKEPYDAHGEKFNCWRKVPVVESSPSSYGNSVSKNIGTQTEDSSSTTVKEGTGSDSEELEDNANQDHTAIDMPVREEQQALITKTRKNFKVLSGEASSSTSALKYQSTSLSTPQSGTAKDSSDENSTKSQQKTLKESPTRPYSAPPGLPSFQETKFDIAIKKFIKPDFKSEFSQYFRKPHSIEDHHNSSMNENKEKKYRAESKMLDRHIFSMLCYENFASLYRQPYLESVGKLTKADDIEDEMNGDAPKHRIMPMKHAILRQFCDNTNFESDFIVRTYIIKSVWGVVLAALILIATIVTFIFIIVPTFQSDSFLCSIPYHEKQCSICTVAGLVDVYAAFFANWLTVTLHLIISIVNLVFFINAQNRAISRFLDDMKPLCFVAQVAAYQQQEGKNKNTEKKP